MIRLILALILLALPAAAQEPVLRVELEASETIPGQSVSLRLTVLTPTFLTAPPVWPSFETPNTLVRVATSGPASARIDGTTWAGVSRRYQITPLIAGSLILPAADIGVTWSDPDTRAPRRMTLHTDALRITSTLPAGAEDLHPFIAANQVTLSQTLKGATQNIAPGDSVIRTVTATIEGASPMFLPKLLPDHVIDGLRTYPASPVVEETAQRGALGGTRTESVTLVAETGGTGAAPSLSLSWYNLRTGQVETVDLPAIALSVDGPGPQPDPWAATAWRRLGLAFGALGLVTVLGMALMRRTAPVLGQWLDRARARWEGSESRAWLHLKRVLMRRDYPSLFKALDIWATRVPGSDPRRDPRLQAALAALGAARYRSGQAVDLTGWPTVASTLKTLRREARPSRKRPALPELNEGL